MSEKPSGFSIKDLLGRGYFLVKANEEDLFIFNTLTPERRDALKNLLVEDDSFDLGHRFLLNPESGKVVIIPAKGKMNSFTKLVNVIEFPLQVQ